MDWFEPIFFLKGKYTYLYFSIYLLKICKDLHETPTTYL